MPYEPAPPPAPRPRRRRRASNAILGVAALVCFCLSLFNLIMSYPVGIPPEFPLFLALTFIFGVLWLFTRGQGSRVRGR